MQYASVQGCQVDTFRAKFEKCGSKYHSLAQKFSFGPLAPSWPFSRMDLPPCKKYVWTLCVLSEKPYFFTFLTKWMQIFAKFLYFEGFRLQSFVRILKFFELR